MNQKLGYLIPTETDTSLSLEIINSKIYLKLEDLLCEERENDKHLASISLTKDKAIWLSEKLSKLVLNIEKDEMNYTVTNNCEIGISNVYSVINEIKQKEVNNVFISIDDISTFLSQLNTVLFVNTLLKIAMDITEETTDTERVISFKDTPRKLKSFAYLSNIEIDEWEKLFDGIFLFDTNRTKLRGIFFNKQVGNRLVVQVKNEKRKNEYIFPESQVQKLKKFLNTNF